MRIQMSVEEIWNFRIRFRQGASALWGRSLSHVHAVMAKRPT